MGKIGYNFNAQGVRKGRGYERAGGTKGQGVRKGRGYERARGTKHEGSGKGFGTGVILRVVTGGVL